MVFKAIDRVKQKSSLKNIIPVKGRGQIRKVLRDFELHRPKIGLEMDSLPVNLFLRYQQIFSEFEWVDRMDI